MFSSKKEGGLPDLPPPRVPFDSGSKFDGEEDYEDSEPQALPAFPDSPSHNNFSQAAIKDAVADSKVVEMEEWAPDGNEYSEEEDLPSIGSDFSDEGGLGERVLPPPVESERSRRFVEDIEPEPVRRDFGSSKKDVFVKLDKFHSAKKSINDIRGKLEDIDTLIKKIRETKLKEEQEISSWERDVAHAKARVDEVTQNIFEKVA
ncbi:MAG: hypothetical protein ABIG28_00740 [archaeon]